MTSFGYMRAPEDVSDLVGYIAAHFITGQSE